MVSTTVMIGNADGNTRSWRPPHRRSPSPWRYRLHSPLGPTAHSGGDAVLDPRLLDEDGSQNVAEQTPVSTTAATVTEGIPPRLGAQFHGKLGVVTDLGSMVKV